MKHKKYFVYKTCIKTRHVNYKMKLEKDKSRNVVSVMV